MQVPPQEDLGYLEHTCLNLAKAAARGHRIVERYADHPYIEAWIGSVRVNIVPCFRVEPRRWISATDRTPYHTDYMNKRLDARLRDEVRLLKKFMKGIGTYGAEARVGGFSGFLCEIMVLHYGSFLGAIESAQAWRRGQLIDVAGSYSNFPDQARDLFPEPLIAVDPVDPGRNAAAGVRENRFWEFVSACRTFMSRPSQRFFETRQKQVSLRELRRLLDRHPNTVFLVVPKIEAVVDVIWSQLYKTERALRKQLEANDFRVIRSASWSDEDRVNVLMFELEELELARVCKHYGPPVSLWKESSKFLARHVGAADTIGEPWIEEDRWVVRKSRPNRKAEEFLRSILRAGGREAGVASKVSETVKTDFEVLVGRQVLRAKRVGRRFSEQVWRFLKGGENWIGP